MKRWLWLPACLLLSGFVLVGDDFRDLPADEQVLLASAQEHWSQLDADTRGKLHDNARDWLARPPSARAVLRARMQAWDALPPTERARRRAPFAAWLRLDESERVQVRRLAAEFAALPADQQQLLRDSFAKQSFDSQRAWSLGPTLGAQTAPLVSLFAFVPEPDRPGLASLLRELEPQARIDLATLAARLDNAQRERLRRDLLATPAAARTALIRQRLAQ